MFSANYYRNLSKSNPGYGEGIKHAIKLKVANASKSSRVLKEFRIYLTYPEYEEMYCGRAFEIAKQEGWTVEMEDAGDWSDRINDILKHTWFPHFYGWLYSDECLGRMVTFKWA